MSSSNKQEKYFKSDLAVSYVEVQAQFQQLLLLGSGNLEEINFIE